MWVSGSKHGPSTIVGTPEQLPAGILETSDAQCFSGDKSQDHTPRKTE